MKKIIKGKLYDTETAKKIAEWSSSHARNDFNFYEEELYKKKTGEYFIHGEGNAASPYNKYCYGSYTGSENIIPLTYDEAKNWAEKHLDADEYINIFGKIVEDDSKKSLNLYLPICTIEKAKQEASKAGITISEYIQILIEKK